VLSAHAHILHAVRDLGDQRDAAIINAGDGPFLFAGSSLSASVRIGVLPV
jgi:hypothetical protein